MSKRPPSRPWPLRRRPRRWHGTQHQTGQSARADNELGSAFLQELRDALPTSLLEALPQMPVTLLFVVFSQAKAGQCNQVLKRTFGLTEHEADIITVHARLTGNDAGDG
jgi:hypothetical protein